MSVLVTGAAGFIGYHVAAALLDRGDAVVGFDNLNPYYDTALKQARLDRLLARPGFVFARVDIADRDRLFEAIGRHPDIAGIIHMAAQPGVRYSLQNPYAYVDANVMGTLTIFEAARRITGLRALVYASSSAVYGANTKQPFSVTDPVEQPVSLYAATKRSCELLAYSYSHLYRIAATGLRFFTVYGPWGRPDMAPYLFTEAIIAGRPIKVFNHGDMARDFTYIDDIVAGTIAAYDRAPAGDGRAGDVAVTDARGGDAAAAVTDAPVTDTRVPHRLYNLGNHRPERLLDFIAALERAIGRTARLDLQPMQPGDVLESYADIESARRDLGFAPATSIDDGLARFVHWFKQYHCIN
jgi:UDP-glucuronate 4-epimerase